MMKKFRNFSNNQGLTLIELMTVLIIIMLLAMVGFPTYQEYQNRAYLAEAQSTIGTMEKNLRTYYLSHGSFYSAAPTPATVPGLASLGDSGSFAVGGGWATIGPPVANGAAVNYSYQAFAGQTPNDSTTATVNDYLNDPTTNMNLIRRTSSAYNYRFPHSAGIASTEEKLRFDWSDFSFCAQAATDYEVCIQEACGGNAEDTACITKNCTGKAGEPTTGGKTAAQNCEDACTGSDEEKREICQKSCSEAGDAKCDEGNVADIDCYHDTTSSDSPTSPEFDKCIEDCNGEMSCRESCLGQYTNNNCYQECKGDKDCEQGCESTYHNYKCAAVLTNPDEIKACQASDNDPVKDPNAKDGGGAGGGDAGGGDAGGGSDNGGDTGDGSGGEAGGGSGSGDGSTSGDDSGSVSSSNAECASFGISKPSDFGIQTNVAGYNWVVTTAVGNFSPGSECTLVAKVIQVIGGQMSQTDFIKINVGE